MRTCVACRTLAPRGHHARLVRDPAGALHVDRYLKVPGRGAHVCYTPACIENAVQRHAFQRAFKAALLPLSAEALTTALREAIAARVEDALALARRAGATRTGAQALEDLRGVHLLIVAQDASASTVGRLLRCARAAEVPVVRHGTAERLGEIIGRGRRVAVGVTAAPFAASLQLEFERHRRLVGDDPDPVLVAAVEVSR